MVDHTDRRAGQLFTPAAHAVERGGEQLKLPGFGLERTRITPALPLADRPGNTATGSVAEALPWQAAAQT